MTSASARCSGSRRSRSSSASRRLPTSILTCACRSTAYSAAVQPRRSVAAPPVPRRRHTLHGAASVATRGRRRLRRQASSRPIAAVVDASEPERHPSAWWRSCRIPAGHFYRFSLCQRRCFTPGSTGSPNEQAHQHRSRHPSRGSRQDRDLPRRARGRRRRLLPDPRAARLRGVLRGTSGRGDATHHAQSHLRGLPGGPPHGVARRPATRSTA